MTATHTSEARGDLHDTRPEGARLLNVPTVWWDEFARAVAEWSEAHAALVVAHEYNAAYMLALRSLRCRTRVGARLHFIESRGVRVDVMNRVLELAGLEACDAAECLVQFRASGDGALVRERRRGVTDSSIGDGVAGGGVVDGGVVGG